MNYGELKNCDIANGPGVRVSVFVSGCRNHCKGCFNQVAWDFNYGEKFTEDVEKHIIELLKPEYITGLTILGGDPFEPENLEAVTQFCRFVKVQFPKKSIWAYTGYSYEQFVDHEIMRYLDVLVDGRFIEAQKDLSLRFRGSANQRLIDVPKSQDANTVILWDDPHLKGLINSGISK